jgi:hypothetical protein
MYWIDPVGDRRWAEFLEQHPQASMFHTVPWLEALRRTYGYRPIVLTSCPPGVELSDGIAFCEVKSWVSGSRLVSLPFADHCQPLLELKGNLEPVARYLREQRKVPKWKYIEIRPSSLVDLDGPDANAVTSDHHCRGQNTRLPNGGAWSFVKCKEYNLHKVDLRPAPERIFASFHSSCIQRKIRRAQREDLQYEAGRSQSSVEKFYHLLLLTRRRHGLPPQPIAWFRNLAACFGDNLTIRLASKGGRPIASILTLLHKKALVYKYGCSDAALHKLGAMPMLFWKAIQEEKQRGAEEFDLGRSAISNPGLSVFKQHLGAACSRLSYYRLGQRELSITDSDMRVVRAVFARMPAPLAQIAGSVLYRHMG